MFGFWERWIVGKTEKTGLLSSKVGCGALIFPTTYQIDYASTKKNCVLPCAIRISVQCTPEAHVHQNTVGNKTILEYGRNPASFFSWQNSVSRVELTTRAA